MKLVIGLGNPGKKYENTRHNIGFKCAELLAKDKNWQLHTKTNSFIAKTNSFILAKPQTYMNLSGQAVVGLLSFFKLFPQDLIVIHDDVDLPFGRIKLQYSGQSAGHKGLQSIIEKLNTTDFLRVRIGIGRPQNLMPVDDYVLSDFTPEEKRELENIEKDAIFAVETASRKGFEKAQNIVNPKWNSDAKR